MGSEYAVRRLGSHEIQRLSQIDMGYQALHGYEVSVQVEKQGWVFSLRRVKFEVPFERDYDWDWELDDSFHRHTAAGLVYIAEREDSIVGVIEGGVDDSQAMQVHSLYVSRPYRGQGIGQSLLRELEETARKMGLRGIWVETQASNGPAMDFYRSQGFELVGLNCKRYTNSDLEYGETAVFLHKDL